MKSANKFSKESLSPFENGKSHARDCGEKSSHYHLLPLGEDVTAVTDEGIQIHGNNSSPERQEELRSFKIKYCIIILNIPCHKNSVKFQDLRS